MSTIRNPIEWSVDQIAGASRHLGEIGHDVRGDELGRVVPVVREITTDDLRTALERGVDDFMACRTDVAVICVVYPLIGLCLGFFFFNYDLVHLVFPAASGFALLGPFAAIGVYELSRRRERGQPAGWYNALAVLATPAFGTILVLGLGLMVLFALWLGAAVGIYHMTLGPEPPASVGGFLRDVLLSPQGWLMTMMGIGVGFCFAAIVLAVSLVSFPLLVDHSVGLRTAVVT